MRLIDADALLDKAQLAYRIALSEDDISTGKYSGVKFTDNFAVDQDDIVDAATVDAVQVTHCGDCKFRCDFTDGHCECRRWPNIPMSYQRVDPQFDFCSYGKRKENT